MHALCSGTHMSVQLVRVREHESVNGRGHQDEHVAVLVTLLAEKRGSVCLQKSILGV